MAVVEDETKKQIAAGGDDQGIPFRTSFDPFNMIIQQLNKLDTKFDDLRREVDARIDKLDTKIDDLRREVDAKIDKLDARIDSLHQELHNTTRWIIGTIVAVAGVAVALASWLLR